MPNVVATCAACETRLNISTVRPLTSPVPCPSCGASIDLLSGVSASTGSIDTTLLREDPSGPATDRTVGEHTQVVDDHSRSPSTLPDPGMAAGQAARAGLLGFANPSLANYELLGELGRGGVGVVYQARHRTLGRLVALKVILAGAHAGPAAVARFRQEAETIARLQHPGIVQIYEIGEHDGLPFIALELCPGGTLSSQLRSAPLNPKQAAELVEKLARAIQAAHEAGVIHRDLKPGNILLGADGQPRIADFGLAKKLDDSGLTQAGQIMGTPSYMAPEQATGTSSRIGKPTDIYALGAILYELLTGRPPFQAVSSSDTLLQVIFEDPIPPLRLQPKAPRDLVTICLKCLRKEPGHRYASAAALAEDLRRFQAGEPITARPVGPIERLWSWCRRNPAVAGLVALVALSLVAGTVVASLFAWQALAEAERVSAARDDANRQRDAAEKQRLRAEWLIYAGNLREAQLAIDLGHASQARQRLDECRWDFRGWEHAHLWTRLHEKPRTWEEEAPLICLAASSAGQWLASATDDGVVKVRQLEGGKVQHQWRVAGGIGSLAFSADGKWLAAGGENPDRWGGLHKVIVLGDPRPGEIRVWNLQSGQEQPALKGHTREVSSVAFALGNPSLLASSSHDGTITLWDVVAGKAMRTLKGHQGPVSCVRFASKDRRLWSAGWDGTLRIWEVETGTEVKALRGHVGKVFALVPVTVGRGRCWASAGQDKTIKLWDAEGALVRTLRGHDGFVTALESDPAGRIFSASQDRTIRVWDEDVNQELLMIKGPSGLLTDLVFGRQRRLVSAGEDHSLRLWEGHLQPESRPLYGHAGQILCAAFAPTGRAPGGNIHLASGGEDRMVKLWDLQTGQSLHNLSAHEADVTALAWRGDGERLVSGDAEGTILVWNVAARQPALSWRGHPGLIHSLAYSPDGTRLVSGAGDAQKGTGEVKLWDASNGKQLAVLVEPAGRVLQVAFSPDGQWVLVRSGDWEKAVSSLRLLNVATGQVVRSFIGHQGYLTGAAFSQLGKEIVAAVHDREKGSGSIQIWDTATGKELRTASTGVGPLASVAVSPSGTQFLCGQEDGTLTIWDASTLKTQRTLRGHSDPVIGVSWGSRWLVSLGHDGSCRIWPVGGE